MCVSQKLINWITQLCSMHLIILIISNPWLNDAWSPAMSSRIILPQKKKNDTQSTHTLKHIKVKS